MNRAIVLAGATGNLGLRICRQLIKRGAEVRALVRDESSQDTINDLKKMGVDVRKIDWDNAKEVIEGVADATCVVSALTGLHDVIVDTQFKLLKACVSGGVQRFIPSDFSLDFTPVPRGENRNFDLRKEFQDELNDSGIQATSIFNGAFAEILRYNTPLFDVQEKTISYYEGKADWKINFTTMDDTAAYTACAAMDDTTPRFLRISSFSVSPNELAELSRKHKGKQFELVDKGSMADFSAYNKMLRAAHPEGEKELYPQWQQSQYMYSMFLTHQTDLDNNRYEGLSWSPVEENI